ncbi:AAA family ATPase [Amycolatopsis acidicola]|nr:AAA family ATPase [Amycolatopsis acidicola]
MTIEPRTLLVIAGLPGSGKSTLLRDAKANEPVTVLDSDDTRARSAARLPGLPYSSYRPLVHVTHRIRVTLAVLTAQGPVVAHDPATGSATRTWLATLARISRRPKHFLWVECAPDAAAAGQRARGRVLTRRSFRRHVRRLPGMWALLRTGLDGWRTTVVVRSVPGLELRVGEPATDRPRAARTGSPRFAAANR